MSKPHLSAYPFLENAKPYVEGEAFYLFGWTWLPVYSFLIFLGMLFSILTIIYFWKREKLNFDYLIGLILITIPTSIIGARLGFVFEQLSVGNTVEQWWNPRNGGLSIQWGVIFAATCDLIYVYTRRDKLDYRKAISIILPTILIGQAIGRWGNYANHEVFGRIDETGSTVLWLGKDIVSNMYITASSEFGEGVVSAVRVPLFFYEFLSSIIGYFLIVWVFNLFNWLKPGVTGAFYLIWYGSTRASMEYLRQEPYLIYFIIALVFILIGIALAIYYQFFGNHMFVHEGKKTNLKKVIRYEKEKAKFGFIKYINWIRNEETIIPSISTKLRLQREGKKKNANK